MKLTCLPALAMLMLSSVCSQGAALNPLTPDTTFLHSEAPFRYDFGEAEHVSFAQLYGVVDLTFARTNHSLAPNNHLPINFYPYAGSPVNKAARTRSSWINGGLQGSRLGVRGEFGLAHISAQPLKLVYQFEAGFNPLDMSLNNSAETLAANSGTNTNASVSADTSLNGDLFGRQAWAGVEVGKLGRLSYGNQYNPFFDIFAAYDPNSKADTFSPFGESGGVGGGGGISENARMQNSVKYLNIIPVAQQANVSTSFMYQYGNAASTEHGEGMAAQLGYETNTLGIQLAWNKFIDAIRTATAAPGNPLANDTLSGALFNTEATLVTLRWLPRSDLRISGGWQWYQLRPAADSSLRYSKIFDQPVFNGVVTSGLATGNKQNNHVYFLGARYEFANSFPKMTGLSASLGFYDTCFDAIQGPTISTNSQGQIETWTGIIDYVFNRRFDTYLAYTNNHFSGDRFPKTNFYHDVSTIGAGLRIRF